MVRGFQVKHLKSYYKFITLDILFEVHQIHLGPVFDVEPQSGMFFDTLGFKILIYLHALGNMYYNATKNQEVIIWKKNYLYPT